MSQPLRPLIGTVVRGTSRGRTLGFPTANLALSPPVDLASLAGIYAAWARLGNDRPRPAAVHIGPRPTFADLAPLVEVHLLKFPDRDLYGETLSVQLVQKLRDVATFASTAELVDAINNDCRNALAVLEQKAHDI